MGELEITYVYTWGRKKYCGRGDENKENDYVVKAPILLRCLELKRIIAICCSNAHTIALTAYGQIWHWGANYPVMLESLKDHFITQISATTPGANYNLFAAIDRDGDVHCWDKNTIKKIGMPTRTKSIACGEHFYISLGEDSRVYTWTLSNDTVIPIVSLFPSQTGSKVIQIGAGMDGFGAALTEDHNLYTWGTTSGPSGGNFLGHGPNDEGMNRGPKVVEALRNMVSYFSYIHMMAVTIDGDVWGWGDGDTNRLGHGMEIKFRHRDTPTKIPGLCGKGIQKLSLARGNEGALTDSGEVYLWGDTSFGGHHCYKIPTQLVMETLHLQEATIKDISCGKSHSAIITTVNMTLKHLCFRAIALHLENFTEVSSRLPLELREAMAFFLADRSLLSPSSLLILGVGDGLVSNSCEQLHQRYYY